MVEVRYGQYCPVAHTSEILCSRWTMLIIRELIAGSTRLNDLRRGVPRVSPGLLSQRLRELEAERVIARVPQRKGGELYEYELTDAGRALAPIVQAFGAWAQAWIDEEVQLANKDVETLMWHVQRGMRKEALPIRPCVINFLFKDMSAQRGRWWIKVEKGEDCELCKEDPGRDVDLYIATDLPTLSAIWLGLKSVKQARDGNMLLLTGDRDLADSMQAWLGTSPVAEVPKIGGVRAA